MFKDYFYLVRCCKELNSNITDFQIEEAFTQNKDSLILQFRNSELQNYYLMISTNNQMPYLLLRKEFHKAKKNTISFFKEFFPARLKNILIGKYERTIKFLFDSFEIVFMIKGHDTNILLYKDSQILDSFKKVKDKNDMEKFISDIVFYSPNDPDISAFTEIDSTNQQLRKDFPFLSKLLIDELRSTKNKLKLNDLINQILFENIGISYNPLLNRFLFCPVDFGIHNSESQKVDSFSEYNDALFHYLKLHEKNLSINNLKTQIEKAINKKLTFYSEALNNLKKRLDAGSKEDYYYKIGNLLKANFEKIKLNIDALTLKDENGNLYDIKLKRNLTPSENLKFHFDKAKDEKKSFKKSLELYNEYSNNFIFFVELQKRFLTMNDRSELNTLAREMKIENINSNESQRTAAKFREFLIDGKYKLLVGKDSKNNDELTLHVAKKNDYWFHARSVSGSHVVLCNQNQKEIIPKNILKNAASVAAYYSKAKTASLVPVSYTFAKYVIKRKGMEPGKVQIANETVVIVKPEIPKNCIQIGVENEIKV